MTTKPIEVACPGCGKRTIYAAANRWRPFCSPHCTRDDLGSWASERFRIPQVAESPTDGDSISDAAIALQSGR